MHSTNLTADGNGIYDQVGRYAGVAHDCGTNNFEVAKANAKLFAASPDLLAACKSAHALLRKLGGTNHDPEYSELASAIARAEGRAET